MTTLLNEIVLFHTPTNFSWLKAIAGVDYEILHNITLPPSILIPRLSVSLSDSSQTKFQWNIKLSNTL